MAETGNETDSESMDRLMTALKEFNKGNVAMAVALDRNGLKSPEAGTALMAEAVYLAKQLQAQGVVTWESVMQEGRYSVDEALEVTYEDAVENGNMNAAEAIRLDAQNRGDVALLNRIGEGEARFSQDEFGVAVQQENTEQIDNMYMEAVRNGDVETQQKMVNMWAEQKRAEVFAATDVPTYRVRRGATPKVTKTVYKTFTLDKNGRPSALFVSSANAIPVGVWLDAQDTYHFQDQKNGRWYVPSTKNPNTKGGATGRQTSIENISAEDLAELRNRGYLTQNAQNITSLAYRPGWHAGDLPFFPQGGMKIEGSNYENVHRWKHICQGIFSHFDDKKTKHPPKSKPRRMLMDFLTLRGSGSLALSVAFVDLTTHPDTAYSLQSSCCRSIDTWHEP